jgi:hypothetical protein
MALLQNQTKHRLRGLAAGALFVAGIVIAVQGFRALPDPELAAISPVVAGAQRDAREQIAAGAAASLAGLTLLWMLRRMRDHAADAANS